MWSGRDPAGLRDGDKTTMITKIDHGSATAEVATAAGFRVVVLDDEQRTLLIEALERLDKKGPQDTKRRELVAILKGLPR